MKLLQNLALRAVVRVAPCEQQARWCIVGQTTIIWQRAHTLLLPHAAMRLRCHRLWCRLTTGLQQHKVTVQLLLGINLRGYANSAMFVT